ncbi:MAG: Atxe2 family lasso peptide isopeptidase [Sphingomonadaceae bacterium]|nr:Atxe2 family lasso peptide isopeptidase [Sphingomonadaceae bacterium]
MGLLSAIGSAARAECTPPSQTRRAGPARSITPLDLARLRDIGMPDSSLFELPSPLAVSPDGSKVAFLMSQGDPATNSYCRLMMVADIEANAKPRVVDRGGELITLRYGIRGLLVDIGFPDTVTPAWSPDGRSLGYLRRDHGVTQLWRVSVDGGDAAPVTRSPVDIEAWARTAKNDVVVASRPGQIDEAARIDAEGQSGWHYDARFSPEYGARPQMPANLPRRYETIELVSGTKRAARAEELALVEPARDAGVPGDAKIVSLTGARAWLARDGVSPLSPERVHFAGTQGHETACTAEQCAGGIVRLYWGADARSIVYLRREGWANSRMAFYRWTPGFGAPRRLSATGDVLLGCLPRGAKFLCLRETSSLPRRIAEIDPETGIATTVYDPNPEFASLRLRSVERLTWRNDNGLPAWGDLVLPPDYRAGQKLPMIVVQYHSDGFLRGGTGDEYPIFPLAARGFAVLSLEQPATIATALPDLKTWDEVNLAGMKEWADRRSELSSTLTGVGQVVARGIADPARIGITGLSDGASSARFALINSRAFAAAAISQSSFEPKTAMTYGGIAWAEYNRKLGYPPATTDAPDFWRPFSMAINARDMNVPLLIQAADDEYLLALETFTALRENGKPVDMFVYPHEHHIKWQPAHRLAVYDRDIDWFAFWFQNVIDPDPTKAAQYDRWRAMRARLNAASTPGSISRP